LIEFTIPKTDRTIFPKSLLFAIYDVGMILDHQ